MKKVVTIIGGNSEVSDYALKQSFELGKKIIDNGWVLCTGGRGGVMESASKGARTSKKWTGFQIIGILPEGNKKSGNEYLDIILPTGMGLTRNALVVQAGDVCIAISGGAGTLSEIALAWQFGRPIGVLNDTGGWSKKMSGQKLDHRRNEIPGFNDVEDAIKWIKSQTE
mgnify:CR=1 FL=1